MTDNLRVSYSSMNTFGSCTRRFEFDKLYPKRSRDMGDMYAAEVGKAIHAGAQDYLAHKDKEQAIWEFMQAFPYELEFQQSNDYRNFEASLSTMEEILNHTKLEEYELAKIRHPNGTIVPAIEVPFEIRFQGLTLPDGRGVSFIGFIDAIMQSQLTGAFRTWDIKTNRDNIKDATGKYKYDSQQVPYGIVVDHVAEGTVDEFEVIYLDCYIDLLEPTIQIYPFKKTRTDVREWAINKMLQFSSLKRFMEMDYFPRTDGGCMFYKRPCRYLEVCQSRDRESIEAWLLMGEDPAPEKPFEPWIIADIEVGE